MIKQAIKHLIGQKAVFPRFASGLKGKILVLNYHDIGDDQDRVASWMRIPLKMFEKHLHFFKEAGCFLTKEEFINKRYNPDRLNFLLTFDDGYVNNFKLAVPLLKKLNIPAVFFISTQNALSQEPFWFDVLVSAVQLNNLSSLNLAELGLENYLFPDDHHQARKWEKIQQMLENVKEKAAQNSSFYDSVVNYVKKNYPNAFWYAQQKYRPMNEGELYEVSQDEYFSLGSHSHRHELLTDMPEDDIGWNLQQSIHFLRKVTGNEIKLIAYPNGNVNELVLRKARENGFENGFITQHGFWAADENTMNIPRLLIGAFDTEKILRFILLKLLWNERG